jgi:hypothetical protein
VSKFEELKDIIARKKNKNDNSESDVDNLEIEVAGSESSNAPLLSCGDDETDMDLIDQLYRIPKHKPLMGELAWID